MIGLDLFSAVILAIKKKKRKERKKEEEEVKKRKRTKGSEQRSVDVTRPTKEHNNSDWHTACSDFHILTVSVLVVS